MREKKKSKTTAAAGKTRYGGGRPRRHVGHLDDGG